MPFGDRAELPITTTGLIGQDGAVSGRGTWTKVRGRLDRASGWVVAHPVLWGVRWGVVLVVLGLALELAPIVVLAVGAAIGVLNILHARRRGYCPIPAEPGRSGDRGQPPAVDTSSGTAGS